MKVKKLNNRDELDYKKQDPTFLYDLADDQNYSFFQRKHELPKLPLNIKDDFDLADPYLSKIQY